MSGQQGGYGMGGGQPSPQGYGGYGGGYGGMGGYGGQRRMPGPPSPWGQSGASLNYGSAPWMQAMSGPPSQDVMSGAARGIPQLAGAGADWLPNFNSATPQYYNQALWAAHPSNPANQGQAQAPQAPFAPTSEQQGSWTPGASGGASLAATPGAPPDYSVQAPYVQANAPTWAAGSGQGGGQAAYQQYLQSQQQQLMPGSQIRPIKPPYGY